MTRKERIDTTFRYIVFFAALITVISLAAILLFTLLRAIPLFKEVNIFQFISSSTWSPSTGEFGILSFIVASILTTTAAIIIGIPIGLYTAIFISELAPKWLKKVMLFTVEILAAIPSVVYGFFGLTIIVPLVQNTFHLRSGATLLSASILLAFMILPTVVSLSTSALQSVPKTMDEASLALGASKMETIFKVKLAYAKSGILTSFLLGLGRALGETMAVILVAGNSNMMPTLWPISEAFLNGGRTLTGNIVLELGYASGTHQAALFATGVVLFIFVSMINLVILRVKRKGVSS